jgi:hypothetical protein
MNYFYYHIPNLNFIKIYTYKYHYAKSQQTQNYDSYLRSILPP